MGDGALAQMLASLPGLMQMMQMSESFIAADHQSSWMLPACGSVVYLSIIFFLKNIASLPVYQLKEVAVIHNLILISLSVVMFFGGVSSCTIGTRMKALTEFSVLKEHN